MEFILCKASYFYKERSKFKLQGAIQAKKREERQGLPGARSGSTSFPSEFLVDLFLFDHLPQDPFAEANAGDSGSAAGSKDYIHVRIQQRNGRKSLTTVQGLKKEFSYSKILKDLKKEFCCNGTVVQDPELGQVIQLQGDQRKNVSNFLVQAGIVKKEHIKIHGF
ncbi:unnamed protein product [Miscanthus lutarioriparius]|uniref:Protein translation factor SUI1 homolog n=1 Tax=Miscanthus lutarioriparius TaxID=422564 RepID=A0A811NFB2_9POAL|nr:unnamed protein product [Miscanthus lutarioriparius]